jgi:hypothetical protein
MIFVRSKHFQKFVGSCVAFTSAAVILRMEQENLKDHCERFSCMINLV